MFICTSEYEKVHNVARKPLKYDGHLIRSWEVGQTENFSSSLINESEFNVNVSKTQQQTFVEGTILMIPLQSKLKSRKYSLKVICCI